MLLCTQCVIAFVEGWRGFSEGVPSSKATTYWLSSSPQWVGEEDGSGRGLAAMPMSFAWEQFGVSAPRCGSMEPY